MTVYTCLKYMLIFASLLGLTLICAGGWKVWSSYNYSQHAEVKQGTFRGYHLHRYQSSTRDSSGTQSYRMVEEYLPMFSYRDASGRHEITGTDNHFFKHLSNKVDEPVKVLVSPDNSSPPRLGDVLSLYCNAVLMILGGLIFFIIPLAGVKFVVSAAATQTGGFGQSIIPMGDLVIVLGGFFLIGGSVFGFIYYYTSKLYSNDLI